MSERYEISPWFDLPAPADQRGRALVLPGGGYTVDHPALFWSCQVLTQVGWRVTTMRWRADGLSQDDVRAFVEEGAECLDSSPVADSSPDAPDHQKTLILGKSLGSYAARWASARRYPAIWLTPVLTDPLVADALRDYAAPSLLIGGTDDQLWRPPTESPVDQRVLQLDGVDHALHRPGDWRASIAVLHDVLAAVERFSADVAAS